MAQGSPYWIEVNTVLQEIEVGVTKQSRQPSDGVFITSLKNRIARTEAGVISGAPRKLAAQCIVNGTHRLATDDEILAWETEQAKRREAAKLEAMRQKGTFVVQQPTK